ncbi:2-oxo-4-hydroxy-4-carboxy-5-ureidoimidazoline decarboxylase [Pocillopora verrucosa]|uniref:2-oxo-4-hydroxy-4-carboxy-5-ureidoimidazoline decarboxylase n=1 Tax=Pocillopora verrucosa TaxID=203993 RepID=UPI00279720FE|nr:2-oxo-4-hydroxy-4-carboxy-5-ureidoimidazoline decarboxylase-like [Pocillopora verrucosa]
MASKLSISAVNELYYRDFIRTFGNVIEETKICAAAVCGRRPFRSFDNFVEVMCQFIDELPKDGRAGILRNHPDLADRLESLTPESQREQTHAGITTLTKEEIQELKHYNQLYSNKFGFPFVICARLNNKDAILKGIKSRLNNDRDQELECGIEEVKKIMQLRMKDLVECEDSKL